MSKIHYLKMNKKETFLTRSVSRRGMAISPTITWNTRRRSSAYLHMGPAQQYSDNVPPNWGNIPCNDTVPARVFGRNRPDVSTWLKDTRLFWIGAVGMTHKIVTSLSKCASVSSHEKLFVGWSLCVAKTTEKGSGRVQFGKRNVWEAAGGGPDVKAHARGCSGI